MITSYIKEVKLSPRCSHCGKFTPFYFTGTIGKQEIFCSIKCMQKYYNEYIEMDYKSVSGYGPKTI